MQIHDPFMHGIKKAARERDRILSTLNIKKKNVVQAAEFLGASHRYKLITNGVLTGDKRVMNGRAAKELNGVLLQDFRDKVNVEIDAGVPYGATKSLLSRWVIDERFVNPEEV